MEKWEKVTGVGELGVGEPQQDILQTKSHTKFFKRVLAGCPARFSEYDCFRVMLAFFCLSGLDILNALDSLSSEFKQEIIEWLYHLQVLPVDAQHPCYSSRRVPGFQGTSTMMVGECSNPYESSHLTMTYTALSCLVVLGDDLSRVDRPAVARGLARLQQPDGSWSAADGDESDMRFVYSASCISYILNDRTGMDLERMVGFIQESVRYDGGVGQRPGLESHGGSTYCALAALALTDHMHALSPAQIERLGRWCIMRQTGGLSGRPHKQEDTCYSFWVGGSLALLGGSQWLDAAHNRRYVLSAQHPVLGGIAKWPDNHPDPMHTFLGLAGLSLNGEESLARIVPYLPITTRAHEHLKQLHVKWAHSHS